MVRRASRPRGARAPGVALVIAAGLVAGTLAHPVSRAQPAPADPSSLGRARDLYEAAEAAVNDGRFDDAVRDYAAAYELRRDPALLFKLGRAHERAGRCDVALTYYARYLREGQPAEPFAATTRARITACGGDPAHLDAYTGSTPARTGSAADSGTAPGATAGSAARGATAGSAAPGATTGSAAPGSTARSAAPGSTTGSAAPGSTAGSAAPGSTAGSAGSGGPAQTPDSGAGSGSGVALLTPTHRQQAAWLLTGSAVALAALGGILAYASNSSENDLRDLYAGLGGKVPAFDDRTRKSYDDLIDQGHRYQHLSWGAFGLAGAAAVGAVILFATGRRPAAEHARISPVVAPGAAGVAVRF